MNTWVAVLAAVGVSWSLCSHRSSTLRAGLRPPQSSAAVLGAGSVLVVCVAWRLLRLSAWMLIASCLVATTVAVAVRRHRRRLRLAAVEADVVPFCLALAAEIRTGRMPEDAVAAAVAQLGPLASGMSGVARAVAHGAPLDTELAELADLTSSRRLSTVAAVWSAATSTGARIADVLERVALAFTAEDDAVADLDAAAAGPRATASVLGLLPVMGVMLGAAIGAHPLEVLLHSELGALLLAGATLLDAFGVWWVRRITSRVLRG